MSETKGVHRMRRLLWFVEYVVYIGPLIILIVFCPHWFKEAIRDSARHCPKR